MVMKHVANFLLHTPMVVHTAILPIAGILGIAGILAAFSRLAFYNGTLVSNILNPEHKILDDSTRQWRLLLTRLG